MRKREGEGLQDRGKWRSRSGGSGEIDLHGEGQSDCQWREALELFGHVWWAIVYGQIKPSHDASLIT